MKDIMGKFKFGSGSGGSSAYTWFGVKKELIVRIALAAVLFLVGLFAPLDEKIVLVLMLLSFLISGYDLIILAIVRLANERIIGEELLVVIAAVLAFTINEGYEAAAVMLIYQAGCVLRSYALELTRGNLKERVDPYPAPVTVLRGEDAASISPELIQIDDILLLHPGERVPVDSEVMQGESSVDLSTVLGRNTRKDVVVGQTIPAGAVNVTQDLRVRAIHTMADSVFNRALDIASDENNIRSSTEEGIQGYARVYAPFALGFGILITLLLLIFTDSTTEEAIHRALVLLIVACPTAMLIPIPFTYLSGLYRSLQKGVLVKDAAILDSIARSGAVIFDKEDIMAPGEYRVAAVKSDRLDPNVLLKVAAHAASGSGKSMYVSIVDAYDGIIDNSLIQRFEEFEDGIASMIDGVIITMGNREYMSRLGIQIPDETEMDDNSVLLALNGRFAGSITLAEMVRDAASTSVQTIESAGIDCIMLSAASAEDTKAAASAAGIREYYSQCMPIDRLEKIQEIKERYPVNSVLYMGHGIADEGSLAAADVGICTNGIESEDAMQGGSVVIMDKAPEQLVEAVNAAKLTRKTVRQSFLGILAIKLIMLILSVFGITYQLWFAAMIDVVACVAGILYSARVWKE